MLHNEFWELPWYKKVLLILLLPFMIPVIVFVLCLFIPLVIFAIGYNYFNERRFRSRMIRCGRYVSHRELSRKLQDGATGTLIIESPSMGWNFTHAWWTPDDLLEIAPTEQPTKEDYHVAAEEMQAHPWDEWCWKQYTSSEQGNAFLIRVWNGSSIAKRLHHQHKSLKLVETWTAIPSMEEICESGKNID